MDELRAEIGAEDLAAILDVFLDEAAVTIAGLRPDLDDDVMERTLHFIRSGALNMGLDGLADRAMPGGPPGAALGDLSDILAQTRAQLHLPPSNAPPGEGP